MKDRRSIKLMDYQPRKHLYIGEEVVAGGPADRLTRPEQTISDPVHKISWQRHLHHDFWFDLQHAEWCRERLNSEVRLVEADAGYVPFPLPFNEQTDWVGLPCQCQVAADVEAVGRRRYLRRYEADLAVLARAQHVVLDVAIDLVLVASGQRTVVIAASNLRAIYLHLAWVDQGFDMKRLRSAPLQRAGHRVGEDLEVMPYAGGDATLEGKHGNGDIGRSECQPVVRRYFTHLARILLFLVLCSSSHKPSSSMSGGI